MSNTSWKDFVNMLLEIGVKNTSKEIANIINSNNNFPKVTWFQVAGIMAAYTKRKKKNI